MDGVVAFAAVGLVGAGPAVDRVVARTAEQDVVAIASLDDIVAPACVDPVGAGAPNQGVVGRTTLEVVAAVATIGPDRDVESVGHVEAVVADTAEELHELDTGEV